MPDNVEQDAGSIPETGEFPPESDRWELAERTKRLKEAVRQAGGPKAVSAGSGVPPGTISNYMLGREMKATAMVAIARACKVSLEWLAAGLEPMEPPRMPARVSVTQTVYSQGDALFATLDMARLGSCVRSTIAALGGKLATDQEIGRLVALSYDAFDRIAPEDLFTKPGDTSEK